MTINYDQLVGLLLLSLTFDGIDSGDGLTPKSVCIATFLMTVPQAPQNPQKLPNFNFSKRKYEKTEKQNDFHKQFKQIPKTEHLIRTFRCAVAKPTLFDGKLWLSEHHICFKINWPSNSLYIIKFVDIVDIRKASFANMIPNAIEVETIDMVYFFGSIIDRDEKWNDLVDIWRLHVDKESLWNKYPVLQGLDCSCSFPELRTCDVCIKHIEMNKYEKRDTKTIYQKQNKSEGALGISMKQKMMSTPELPVWATRDLLSPDDEKDTIPRGWGSNIKRAHSTSKVYSSTHSGSSSPVPEDSVSQIPRHNSAVTLNDGLDCDCKEDGYNLMHESIIQAPLSTIWKQWFSFEKEGLFVQYLHTVQKITDLKFSNWVPEGQDDDECIPVEQVACNVAWDAVKPGMHRKSSRMVPLNHGMPFIPKQTVALNDFKVLHASESKLGVQNIANIVAVGIMTNLKYCFTQLNDQQTKFQLYGQIIFTGKGKFSVPQGILNSLVLAEKSTIQGVLAFYEQLKEFLALYLKVAPSASCSCLTMIDSDGYRPLVNTTMSMDIKSLWKSIFCVDPSGNLYTRTIFEKMKWTEVEFEPWRMKDEAEKELKAVEETNGDGFTIPFDSIQPLMKRRMHYSVPLNHSIPFVPKTVRTQAEMIVHRQTNDSVCVNLTTLVPDIGVVTTIKICFQAMTDDTRVTCIGTVSFQKGKYPIPKGTAEKSAYESMQAFYSTLFPASSQNVNNTVATPLPKAEQPQPRVLTEMIEQFVRSIPTEYMVYFILFLGLMFLFNTLILWNLVYAMERQHQQIMLLKKALE